MYPISYDCSHRYIAARHTVISCSHITVTYAHRMGVHACIVFIFLSYGLPCILHVLLFHVPVFMIVSCYWYGYTRYWTWELLICDMWNPTSIVPVILFPLYCSRDIVPVSRYIVPVILFYAINRALVQLSCYPYHVLLFVLVTLDTDISDHNDNWVMGGDLTVD